MEMTPRPPPLSDYRPPQGCGPASTAPLLFEALADYDDGATAEELAVRCGCSVKTSNAWLRQWVADAQIPVITLGRRWSTEHSSKAGRPPQRFFRTDV